MKDFLHFLKKSPTAYHAAEALVQRLTKAGFSPLLEKDKWKLTPGQGYFFARGDSLVAAFRVPKKTPTSAILLGCHLDSPGLKLKPKGEISNHAIGELNTEVYGAPLLHTWLDRDLCIAGQYTTSEGTSKLVHLTDHPVIIPSLAIHLDRTIGEKGFLINKQDHLKAIFSLQEKTLGSLFPKMVSSDLFLVPLEAPSSIGFDREMIASYKLDNLTSAFAACEAISLAKSRTDALQMALFFDHEEIGSVSVCGADSLFTEELLKRIGFCLQMDFEDICRMKSASLCISSDLAHGFHPNFADKFDPQNIPFLGRGVVIKFNANQKYATSGISAAKILRLAKKHKIPIQTFASRSDIPSGSTIGSMVSANTGIATVDLGIPSWAMHSIRETIATQDEISLCNLFHKALEDL